MESQSVKKSSPNLIFIDAFLKGTVHTLKVQCSYEVVAGKSFVYTHEAKINTDICGLIGLTSDAFRGSITLCFSQKIFLDVMSSMFGEKFTEITDELSDGAGELLNIIFGTAKTTLVNNGFKIEKAIPTIVRGTEIKINSLTGGGTNIVVPFTHNGDTLHVIIGLGDLQSASRPLKAPLSVVKQP